MVKGKAHARLRLVTVGGALVSSGYKSGRKRWRETPDTSSMARTLSAGTRLAASQPETVPCDFKPRHRAKAVCPPTDLQASINASLLMRLINAQTVDVVNAGSVNGLRHSVGMGRKAESEPSAFWRRLTEAMREQDLPISQNGIAVLLDMSQGSVARWFHGEGLPEIATCRDLALRGEVSVDWLLTGRKPKYPLSKDPLMREIFDICEDLDETGRQIVLRAARGELLQKQAADMASEKERTKRA